MSLDNQERRALSEIERELARQDPRFAARMRATGDRPFPTLFVLGVLFYVSAPLISLLFGATAMVIAAVTFAAGITVVLVRRRRRPGRA